MRNLINLAINYGDALQRASIALESIADLVGADGSDHALSSSELNGLKQAVYVIGSYLGEAGVALWQAGEEAESKAHAQEAEQ